MANSTNYVTLPGIMGQNQENKASVLIYHDSNFYFSDFFQSLRYFSALCFHILMEYLYFHLGQKLLDSYTLFLV